MACHLSTERVWIEKSKYHDAEKNYFEQISKLLKGSLNKNKDENNQEKENTVEVVRHNNNMKNAPSTEESNFGITISSKSKKNKKIKISDGHSVSEIPNKKSSVDQSQSIQKNSNVIENNDSIGEDIKLKKKKNKKKSSTLSGGNSSEKLTDKAVLQCKDESQELWDVEKDKDKKTKLNLKNKATGSNQCTLVSEIAKARQHIKNSLERMDGIAALAASPGSNDVLERLAAVERENIKLRDLVESLNKCCSDSAARLKSLEQKFESLNVQSGNAGAPTKVSTLKQDDDDDGVDLFGSDSEGEDAEAAKVREARLAAYAAKKSKKPALIAKSSLVLDVKPWDDETDLKMMETEIRKITCDGLLWGASKFMPVAFGIQKLSITCVVEDEKVSIDWLTEEIEKFEDFVQSVDVAAFNKI